MLKVEVAKVDDKEIVFINDQSSDKTIFRNRILDLQKNLHDFKIVSAHSFEELKANKINEVLGRKDKDDNASMPSLVFTICTQNTRIQNRIEIGLFFDFTSWKKPYSINEFNEILQYRLSQHSTINTKENIILDGKPFRFTLSLYNILIINLLDNDIPINFITEISEILEQLVIEIIKELDNKFQLDIYSTIFSFPQEFKMACTQYLVYFAQFLADLGIEVQTEIKDISQGTFFSIIPQNKAEAMGNVKALLSEFMNAPGRVEFDTEISSYQDISAIQWHDNVLHLKSQIGLAKTQLQMKDAVIQIKDATINSLNLINYQLSEKITPTSKKGEEQIIDGILSVSTVEKFGVKLNLAELIRRLKRKF
jgi:hypothetical protein